MNHELFRSYQPKDLDDQYHLFDRAAVLSTVYWAEFFREIRDVQYDTVIECGVGRGKSLIQILSCLMVERNEYERDPVQVYALDSFEGFPEPSKFDRSPRNSEKGDWSHSPSRRYKYSEKFLRLVLQRAGFPRTKNLKIIKGFFSQTCAMIPKQSKVGILHLDGDLYESVRDPLLTLSSLLVRGGLIIFDDFLAKKTKTKEKFPGARKAFEEFQKANRHFKTKISIRGNPYLIKQ